MTTLLQLGVSVVASIKDEALLLARQSHCATIFFFPYVTIFFWKQH